MIESIAKSNGHGRRVRFGERKLVSVDVAQEEKMVPSTVPASGVLRVEGPLEVIPIARG